VNGRLLRATLASGAVGAAVMLLFDGVVARIVGVLLLFVFMVCGLFLVADPGYLAEEEPPGH
jgi:hypothetical protein